MSNSVSREYTDSMKKTSKSPQARSVKFKRNYSKKYMSNPTKHSQSKGKEESKKSRVVNNSMIQYDTSSSEGEE